MSLTYSSPYGVRLALKKANICVHQNLYNMQILTLLPSTCNTKYELSYPKKCTFTSVEKIICELDFAQILDILCNKICKKRRRSYAYLQSLNYVHCSVNTVDLRRHLWDKHCAQADHPKVTQKHDSLAPMLGNNDTITPKGRLTVVHMATDTKGIPCLEPLFYCTEYHILVIQTLPIEEE